MMSQSQQTVCQQTPLARIVTDILSWQAAFIITTNLSSSNRDTEAAMPCTKDHKHILTGVSITRSMVLFISGLVEVYTVANLAK